MSELKKQIINEIIDIEGGYVNNANDSGGETKYGITVKIARDSAYLGDMRDLPRKLAFDIYSKKYWDSVKADDIASLSEAIAREVVDTSVNMGPKRASIFLQRSLNVLNNREHYYPDILIDGKIGPLTISSLFAYLKNRNETVLLKMLNSLQGAFYVDLAERREKDETFIYGWFRHRIT